MLIVAFDMQLEKKKDKTVKNTDSCDHTYVPCLHMVNHYVVYTQHHDAYEVVRAQQLIN